jgi:hypothetical protein
MFRHTIDPLCQAQFNNQSAAIMRLETITSAQATVIADLSDTIKALEDKLDQLLSEAEKAPERSIPENGKAKQPEIQAGLGKIPWSERKRQRIAEHSDKGFIDKVRQGASPKQESTPTQEPQHED